MSAASKPAVAVFDTKPYDCEYFSKALAVKEIDLRDHEYQAFLTRAALSVIARVAVENLQRFSTGLPFMDGTVL